MDTDDKLDYLNLMLARLRFTILTSHRPDSCIYSTGIIINLLRKVGVTVEPLVTNAICYNQIAWEIMSKGRIEEPEPEGGYTIGLGMSPPSKGKKWLRRNNKWNAHLVAFLPDLALLMDLSLDQVRRDEHGIMPTRYVFSTASMPGFDPGNLLFPVYLNGSNASDGVAVYISPDTKPRMDFKKSPDWKRAKNSTEFDDFTPELEYYCQALGTIQVN